MTEQEQADVKVALYVLKHAKMRLFGAHVTGNTPSEPAYILSRAMLHLMFPRVGGPYATVKPQ